MKNYLALLLLLFIVSCSPDNRFKINGTFKGNIEDQWIYLSKFMADVPNPDSVFLQKGKFQFSGLCGYPESYVIQNHRDSALAWFHFYLEPGKINIDLDPRDWAYGSNIQGGPINEEYNTNIRAPRNKFIEFRDETLEVIAVADSSQKIELKDAILEAGNANKMNQIEYVRNNPDSPISPYLLGMNFFVLPIDEAEILLGSFSVENKQTAVCISFQEKLDMLKQFSNGSLETE